jgi:hypothetical protein
MNQVGLPRQYLQLPQVGQSPGRWVFPPPVEDEAMPITPFNPRALSNASVITGGVPVPAITGPINGGFITNPINSAAQGIVAAENLYVDMVAAPGSTDAAGHNTTVILQSGQNFVLPPLAAGVNVWINAATSGHQITGEVW